VGTTIEERGPQGKKKSISHEDLCSWKGSWAQNRPNAHAKRGFGHPKESPGGIEETVDPRKKRVGRGIQLEQGKHAEKFQIQTSQRAPGLAAQAGNYKERGRL